jgi:hypothetical protein
MTIFQIAQTYNGKALPLEIGEHPNVTVGSPLAVIGLFVLALQHRFSPGARGTEGLLGDSPDLRDPVSWEDPVDPEPLPWIWTGDLKPADECTPGNTRAPRPIFVGPAFDKNKGIRNYRPAIYVDRGNVVIQKVSNNNFVGQHSASGLEAFGAIAKIPIQIDCIGESYGDSSIIADTVWFYILASRNILSRTFGFHQIVEPVLGATLPEENDKQVFHTQIFCDVELFLRWSTRPIAPLINDIVLRVAKAGSVDEVLVDIVLRESRS